MGCIPYFGPFLPYFDGLSEGLESPHLSFRFLPFGKPRVDFRKNRQRR
jgi:hypothetical protein